MGKRDDILEATLQLIVEDGLQSLTLAKILDKANAGSGTLYNYFSNKEDLIQTLYEELRIKIGRIVLANYNDSESVRIRFDQFVLGYIEYCIEYLDEMNFIEQYSYYLYKNNKIIEVDDAFYYTLVNIIEEGQNQKIIKDYNVVLIIQIINGIIMSVSKGIKCGKMMLQEDEILEVVNSCWNSVKI